MACAAISSLLNELEQENETSARVPWGSPSEFIYGWIKRALADPDTTGALETLLNELRKANDDSATDPWGSPSTYLTDWIKRARAAV